MNEFSIWHFWIHLAQFLSKSIFYYNVQCSACINRYSWYTAQFMHTQSGTEGDAEEVSEHTHTHQQVSCAYDIVCSTLILVDVGALGKPS